MRILRFIVTWAFSTNEKVWKLSVSTRALSCQRRRTVKPCVLQEDASSYFNLKSFSCQVQQEVFLTLVSDVFLNLSFDLPVLPPLFAYLNKLDRSPSITLWCSFVLILKRQVVFVFICLKISTFCLQILIRCCQKQTVWHWRARHQPKVYTVSNKSNFNLEFRFGSCSMKILHLCCISVRGILLL